MFAEARGLLRPARAGARRVGLKSSDRVRVSRCVGCTGLKCGYGCPRTRVPRHWSRSSRGPGHRPLTAVTGVRNPLRDGMPFNCIAGRFRVALWSIRQICGMDATGRCGTDARPSRRRDTLPRLAGRITGLISAHSGSLSRSDRAIRARPPPARRCSVVHVISALANRLCGEANQIQFPGLNFFPDRLRLPLHPRPPVPRGLPVRPQSTPSGRHQTIVPRTR